MSKIYTRAGDSGKTKTLCGVEVLKDNCLIEVNGRIDDLQVSIDRIMAQLPVSSGDFDNLKRVQLLLWQLGGEISGQKIGDLVKHPIRQCDVDSLENWIDAIPPKVTSFQRFRTIIAIDTNEVRVRTRELERVLVQYMEEYKLRKVVYAYINRLSDYFFALSVRLEQDWQRV